MTSTSMASTLSSYQNDENNRKFHLFSHLHDELQINILSYIADAPLEDKTSSESSTTTVINTDTAASEASYAPDSLSSHCLTYSATLTHVLPHVCKKFHEVCTKSDQLWKDAILRQLIHQSQWCDALQNIIHRTTNCTYNNIITQSSSGTGGANGDETYSKYEHARQLIDHAYQIIAGDMHQQTSYNRNYMSYQYMYRTMLNTQIRQILPVFIMNGDVVLNEPYGLHLFEYRYRYMMLNLMRQHTNLVRQANANGGGSPTSTSNRTQLLQQYPIYFIHANRGNVRRSEMAVIVQVLQCDLHPDGRADIVVKPIHFVWIERSWLYTTTTNNNNNNYPLYSSEYVSGSHHPTSKSLADTMSQPPPHNLYYAQVLKMGRKATNWMHYLQRRETLTNIMERLIASGIIVQDDDGIHRPNPELPVRPVHLNFFDVNHDDDDEDYDGEEYDEDIDDNDDDGEDR